MRYEHAYVGERTERTRRIHDKLSLLIRTDCDLCGQGASKQGAEHDASRQIIGSSLRASFYQHAICHRPVECAAVARNALRAARLISLTHRRWPSGKPRSRAARGYRLARRRGGHAARRRSCRPSNTWSRLRRRPRGSGPRLSCSVCASSAGPKVAPLHASVDQIAFRSPQPGAGLQDNIELARSSHSRLTPTGA